MDRKIREFSETIPFIWNCNYLPLFKLYELGWKKLFLSLFCGLFTLRNALWLVLILNLTVCFPKYMLHPWFKRNSVLGQCCYFRMIYCPDWRGLSVMFDSLNMFDNSSLLKILIVLLKMVVCQEIFQWNTQWVWNKQICSYNFWREIFEAIRKGRN